MSVATINTRVASAVSSIDSGDYATALTKLLGVKAFLAALPNTKHSEVELEWDREAIDSLITNIRKERLGAAGMRRNTVTYKAATSTETW